MVDRVANPLPPTLDALEKRLGFEEGSLEGVDKARAEAALEDAAILVLAEVAATTATRWAEDAHPVATLVALKAARREFENPRGLASESLGEHAIGTTDTSGVYLTASEVLQVRRAATGQRKGYVGEIRTPSAYSAPPIGGAAILTT